MAESLRLILIEDNLADAELILQVIRKSGIDFDSRLVQTREELIEAIPAFKPDIILSDYSLPTIDGEEAFQISQELDPLVPFILVTGSVNEETAISFIKAGVDDYILKHNLNRLAKAIETAIEKKRLIAEKREAKKGLCISEARYRSLFENSAIPIFEEDFSQVKRHFDKLRSAGITNFHRHFDEHPEEVVLCASMIRITDVNNESIRFFQAKNKEEIFQDMSTYFLDESWPVFKEELIALAEGHSYFECEIPVSTFKWELRNLILKLSVRPESIDTLDSVLVSFVDITDRKLAEAALSESEDLFRTAFENASVGVCMVDDNGRFLNVNNALCNFWGYPREELLTMHFQDVAMVRDNKEQLTSLTQMVTGTIKQNNFEIRCTHKNGSTVWAAVSSGKVHSSRFMQGYYVSYIQDITKRKQAEITIRKSAELYCALTENMKDVILILDPELMKATYISPSVYKMLGYKPEEILSLPLDKLLGDVNSDKLLIDIRKIIADAQTAKEKTGTYHSQIYRQPRKDGSYIWAEISVYSYLNAETGKLELRGTLRDITAQKKVEEDLIAAKERAEENDRLKTAFLNNISHEIRTPMNAIIGFTGFLNEPDLQPEKRKYFTDIVNNASNQLLSIITDLINIATIEAGQEKLKTSRVNINQILRNAYNQFEIKASSKQVELECYTPLPDELTFLETDETKLIQIINNLLGNAFKFTRKGFIRFGYIEKEHFLEFFVSDSGIGIPENMHEEIFERFRQADSTIARQYGGTGLGLSISKAYIELLGGTIWLESTIGSGSTFRFTIPFESIENQLSLGKSPVEEKFLLPGKEKIILVAEDEDLNYMLLKEILSGQNLKLIRVVNGAEAVIACKTNPAIDLVIMDIKMPVMDGFEATRLIKQKQPDLPVIIQTAYSRESDMERAFQCGCDGYVSKPIVIDQLIGLMKKFLSAEHLDHPATQLA